MQALFGIGYFELLFLVALASIIFIIWALIDIARSKFPGDTKVIWVLAVVIGGLIGTIVYFVVGRSQKISENEEGRPGQNPFGE